MDITEYIIEENVKLTNEVIRLTELNKILEKNPENSYFKELKTKILILEKENMQLKEQIANLMRQI